MASVLKLVLLGLAMTGVYMVLKRSRHGGGGDRMPLTAERLRMLNDAELRAAHDFYLVEGVDM
jgi:hypothetical protein